MKRSTTTASRVHLLAAWALVAALLASATAQDPKEFPGNKPETIEPATDGSLKLPASKCEVYGTTLQYMPEDKALGWWNTSDDQAVWKLSEVRAGSYDVWFEWSCADEAAGNTFVLTAGDYKLKGKIASTGSWQKHQKAKVGTIKLPAGDFKLQLMAEGDIKEALGDFREIKLVPAS